MGSGLVDLENKSTVLVTLVGLPGSGKSTVGKELSKKYGWKYIDSDEEIEKKTSRTIANIIREDGERAFRKIESTVIHDLVRDLVSSNYQYAVLSVGGGAITTVEVLDLLISKTVTVYLEVAHDVQLKRLSEDKTRPLILADETETLEQKLLRLRKQREKLYEKAMYKIANNGDLDVAEKIVKIVTK